MTTSLTVPTVDRSPPPANQIADYYRDKMRQGEVNVGDLLPTVRTIVAEWRVGEHTVQKALRLLRNEGLIETRQSRRALVIALPAEDPP